MSETRFTPGPWGVKRSRRTRNWYVTGEGWERFARIFGYCGSDSRYDYEAEANAHLIAAAPTMADYIRKKAIEGDAEAQAIWEIANGCS